MDSRTITAVEHEWMVEPLPEGVTRDDLWLSESEFGWWWVCRTGIGHNRPFSTKSKAEAYMERFPDIKDEV